MPRPIVHQADYVRARARYTVLCFGGRLGIRWRGPDVAWPSVWFFLPRGAPTFPPTRRAWHGTPHGDFCSAMDGVDVVQRSAEPSKVGWEARSQGRRLQTDRALGLGPRHNPQPPQREAERPRREIPREWQPTWRRPSRWGLGRKASGLCDEMRWGQESREGQEKEKQLATKLP